MLDELREQAEAAAYMAEEEEEFEDSAKFRRGYQAERGFLGMTAGQRLFIALLLFAMICLLGISLLLVTLRIVPPQLI